MSRAVLLLVVSFGGAGFLACQSPNYRSAAAVAEGRRIYNRSCTVCHGLDGAIGGRGPAVAGTRRYLRSSDRDLFASIRIGIPGTEMPPAGLPEADIWKVVAYIRSLRATAYDAFVNGNAARGETLFWGKGDCGQCHMIGSRGGLLGPDLSNIGAQRTLRLLQEALTEARPNIARGYRPVTVVTGQGQTLTGIIKNEDNFSMQILDTGNKLHLLTRGELQRIVYEQTSLMPSDYGRRLTPPELTDLLAFLSRQAAQRIRRELAAGQQAEGMAR